MAGAGEEVLHQANRAAREASADRIAPGHREEDGDHERQTDRRQEWNLPQNENLDQYGNQGNEDDRGPTEFVDRDLVARSQTSPEWHDSAAHCGGCSRLGGVEGCCELGFGGCFAAGLDCLDGGVVSPPFAGPFADLGAVAVGLPVAGLFAAEVAATPA